MSGRGLFLLFFATLLTISNERPTGKTNVTKPEEIVEPPKGDGDKKKEVDTELTPSLGLDKNKEGDKTTEKDKEVTSPLGSNPNEEDDEEKEPEIEREKEEGNGGGSEKEDEGVTLGVIDTLPTKNKTGDDEGKKDYGEGEIKDDHLLKVYANEAFKEFKRRIFVNKHLFERRIEDRSNPRDVSKLSGKTFKCHHHKIPVEYACHIEYKLSDYSEYEHFIKHFNSTIPKVVKSRSRVVRATEPCHALYRETTGSLLITCGCDAKEYLCKSIANRPAKFVEILKFKSGGKMKLTRTTGQKALLFVHKYIYYLISAFLGLIILIVLLVISIVEWKGMQKNEKKRRERVSKLSQRVERSRNSLRTTCSDPSDPQPEYEYSAFQQLMKKR
ncbi:hypothetical protein PRIPAC_73636 [Pristionchus pacificus]|uniref:Uncharacterized protein n=1 Tax=Pristionchus pacificus TaxID=54126 RepID=A0A8R1YDZ2_PRIPA|nr:hypothetical protein PRIPAC_73636 [Pristionchus pacificus]